MLPTVRKFQRYAKHNLSFLAVVQVSTYAETGKIWAGMQKSWNLLHQMERMGSARKMTQLRREIVNRTFARTGAMLATAALGVTLAGVTLAQTKTSKKAPAGKDAAAVARGKEVFQQKCSTCHNDTSDAKKIGPGLKGIGKRGTFTVNNNKVTDESLKAWIENGDSLMPPFKDVIDDNQIKDVIAYVKTL